MPVQIGAQTIQGVDDTLSSRLSQWGQQLQRESAIKNQAAARKKGQETEITKKDGVAKMPERVDPGIFGSKTAEQHNAGLMDAYLLSIDRDNTEEVLRIAQESNGNLDNFDTVVGQYRKTMLANVDPVAAPDVRLSLDSMIGRSRNQVQRLGIQQSQKAAADERSKAFETYGREAERLTRNGDFEGAQENLLKSQSAALSMVRSGDITEAQADELFMSQKKGVYEQGIKQEIFNLADVSLDSAYDKLEEVSKKVPNDWSPDEWDSFSRQTFADLNRLQSREKKLSKEALKAIELNNSIQRGSLFFNPDIPANPAKSSQDRKDVNNFYNAESPNWQGDLNDVINKNVEFIQNTGIVPDQLIENMNASMRSGNPDHVLTMMEVMQRTQETSPQALYDIPAESKAIALQVSDSMRNGLGPEESIEAARKNAYGLTVAQKAEIKQASTSKGLEERVKNFESMVDDKFDPGAIWGGGRLFPGTPDVPPGMQGAYLSNFGDMMTLTGGNIEQAEKLAFDALQKVWGVTETGGKRRFMQYAPESVYAIPGVDSGWINDQFLEDMESIGVSGAMIGIDANVPRSQTPSYPVLIQNERGLTDIARDTDGNPLRFKPDYTATEEYKELIAAPSVAIENAAQKREREMKRRADVIRRQTEIYIFGFPFIHSPTRGRMSQPDRHEYLKTSEGKKSVLEAVNNMLSTRKIDYLEAKEVLRAYDAGGISDLPGYEIHIKEGLIRAAD